jgi:hypothetical protein
MAMVGFLQAQNCTNLPSSWASSGIARRFDVGGTTRRLREFSKSANSTWRSSTIGWRCRTATAMIMPTPSNTAFAA